jgi:FkbM family methyltransferase
MSTFKKNYLRLSNKINRIIGDCLHKIYRDNDALIKNRYSIDNNIVSINYRPNNLGDIGVISSVLGGDEYSFTRWSQGRELFKIYDEILADSKIPLIMDAGANIGSSSIYFNALFPKAKIIAIEPEKKNCALLRKNTAHLGIDVREAAIGSEAGHIFLTDPGQSSWGFRTAEVGEYLVDVIAISDILNSEEKCIPFICKVDIEGAERQLFERNHEWLYEFAMTVIELHDWMLPGKGTSKPFIRAISNGNFELINRGENTFAFNINYRPTKCRVI